MMHYQLVRTSYKDSLSVLETDIQHANSLAAAIPKAKGGARLQMKLVYNHLAPLFLYFLKWIDCSRTYFLPRFISPFHILIYKVYTDGRPKISTIGRKASVKDFYAVILPSLEQLHYDLVELDDGDKEKIGRRSFGEKRLEGDGACGNLDSRDDECGICLEPCTKMVMPNCCHAMCIDCYRDWSTRSESCPFCRGSLKRVQSRDLWVLTDKDDVIDPSTVSTEDLRRFYLYIRNLPKDLPDALFLMYYEYLLIERRLTEALIEEKISQVLIHCFCEMNSIPADEILRILADRCARRAKGLSGMHSNNQHTRLSCWGRVYGAFSTCVEGFGCGYLFLCWQLLHIPCGRVSAAELMTCTLGSNPLVVILEQRCVWLRCPAMSTQMHARNVNMHRSLCIPSLSDRGVDPATAKLRPWLVSVEGCL